MSCGHRTALEISAPLTRGVHWRDGRILLVGRQLPTTVATSMHGMALAQVISDPDLDPLGLRITAVEEQWPATKAKGTMLITDHQPRWMAIGKLSREEMSIDTSLLDVRIPRPRAVLVESKLHF